MGNIVKHPNTSYTLTLIVWYLLWAIKGCPSVPGSKFQLEITSKYIETTRISLNSFFVIFLLFHLESSISLKRNFGFTFSFHVKEGVNGK